MTYRHVPLTPAEAAFFADLIKAQAGLPVLTSIEFDALRSQIDGDDLLARLKPCQEVDPRDRKIIDLACEQHHKDGEVEVDPDAVVSEGDDNGAYVLAWVWADFAGTDLDKGDEGEEEEQEA